MRTQLHTNMHAQLHADMHTQRNNNPVWLTVCLVWKSLSQSVGDKASTLNLPWITGSEGILQKEKHNFHDKESVYERNSNTPYESIEYNRMNNWQAVRA